MWYGVRSARLNHFERWKVWPVYPSKTPDFDTGLTSTGSIWLKPKELNFDYDHFNDHGSDHCRNLDQKRDKKQAHRLRSRGMNYFPLKERPSINRYQGVRSCFLRPIISTISANKIRPSNGRRKYKGNRSPFSV
jgi:hypothetical protein